MCHGVIILQSVHVYEQGEENLVVFNLDGNLIVIGGIHKTTTTTTKHTFVLN